MSSYHLLLIGLSRHFLEESQFDSLDFQYWPWNAGLASCDQLVIRVALEPRGTRLHFATSGHSQISTGRANARWTRGDLGATLINQLAILESWSSIQLV